MRLKVALFVIGLCLTGATACGSSQSYSQQARASVGIFRSALLTYDHATPSNILSTADACRLAHTQMSGGDSLNTPPSSGPDAAIGHALQHAYQLALLGFADCAASAPYEFVLMARAQSEIGRANAWLNAAKSLDH